MGSSTTAGTTRTIAELTQALFGMPLTIDEAFLRVERVSGSLEYDTTPALWVGSVGYERHKDHRLFAQRLREKGVERLVDVRELAISRRRGYAKTALANAMDDVGIEYVHLKALGNPKPYRELYKSGRVEEGRRCYEQYLLNEQHEALRGLVPLLRSKRSALMCVEDDPAVCHRTVIVDALRTELGIKLHVAQIA